MIRSFVKETVFPEGSVTPSCHAATVLPLPEGGVLAAWFGGSSEKADDVNIYVSDRNASGVWSAPRRVSEDDGVANWNPVLYRQTDGTALLFYKYGREIADWFTLVCRSSDGGRTWTAPEELVPGDRSGGRGPVKNKCLRLENGTLLAPASTERGGRWQPFIDVSADDGATWRANPPMERVKYKGAYVGLIQPTLWTDAPGSVHTLMRSNKGALYRSDSSDWGATWSRPKRTRIPNNNSGIDCAADADGRLWLLSNPVAENWGARYPLSLSVSLDQGNRFTEVLRVEAEKGEYSYPSVVFDGGCLHAVYTWNRRTIKYIRIETE